MLYPKNQTSELSRELFQNPTSEYRGTPFWAWNCQLEKDELLRQLEVMKAMGFGGAHMHVRTGMATPYLSDEHMDLISACVDKCREEQMLAWLYDEDRWPSGAAGGLVTKDKQYHYTFCINEGCKESYMESHSYGRWKVVRTATPEKKGLLKKTCKYCDHALWTNYLYTDNPATGDAVVFPAMLLLTSGAALIPTVYTGRKRRK